MKKLAALLITLSVALGLCACGRSAEPESTQLQTEIADGISLIAETADSMKQDANSAVLPGKWVEVYSVLSPWKPVPDLILNEDGRGERGEESFDWSLSNDGAALSIGQEGEVFDVSELEGTTALVRTEPGKTSLVYVREEDFPRFFDRRFVTVELNMDNFAEYLGEFVRIGGWYYADEGPDVGVGVYLFRNAAYERGLVSVGFSKDCAVTSIHQYPSDLENEEDFYILSDLPFWPQIQLLDFPFVSVSDAEGTLYYTEAGNLIQNEVEAIGDRLLRVIRFSDGTQIVDERIWWDEFDADYNDWKY